MSKIIADCRIDSYLERNDKDLYDIMRSLCLTSSLLSSKGVTFLIPTGSLRKTIFSHVASGETMEAISLLKSCIIHTFIPSLSSFKSMENIQNDNNHTIITDSATSTEVKLNNGSIIKASSYKPVYPDGKSAVYTINGISSNTEDTKIRHTSARKTGGFYGESKDINHILTDIIKQTKSSICAKTGKNKIADATCWFADYLEKQNEGDYIAYAIINGYNCYGFLTSYKYFTNHISSFSSTPESDYPHDSKHCASTLDKMCAKIDSSMDNFYAKRREIQEFALKNSQLSGPLLAKFIEFVYCQLCCNNALVIPDLTSLTSTSNLKDVKGNTILTDVLPSNTHGLIKSVGHVQLHADHEFRGIWLQKLLLEIETSSYSKEDIDKLFMTYNNFYKCNASPMLSFAYLSKTFNFTQDVNALKHFVASCAFLGFGAKKELLTSHGKPIAHSDPRKIVYTTDIIHQEKSLPSSDSIL